MNGTTSEISLNAMLPRVFKPWTICCIHVVPDFGYVAMKTSVGCTDMVRQCSLLSGVVLRSNKSKSSGIVLARLPKFSLTRVSRPLFDRLSLV